MIILRRRPIILRRRALRLSPSYCQVAPGVLLLRHLQHAGHQVKGGKQVHHEPQVLVRYAEVKITTKRLRAFKMFDPFCKIYETVRTYSSELIVCLELAKG